MIKNYFTIAFRNLLRNKVYVLINTFGVGIAMACCLTAYLLIAYNLEFDSYFKKDESTNRIVKVLHHYTYSNGHHDQDLTAPLMMAPRAAQDIAGIEDYTRFTNRWGVLGYNEKAFKENLRFADPSFFDMFKMQLKGGSYQNFKSRQSIFLSAETAKKYFADEDAVGKTMTVEINNKTYDVTVGGVLDKFPLNISFNIQALLPMQLFIDAHNIGPDNWDYYSSMLFKLSDINSRTTAAKALERYATLWNQDNEEVKTTSLELLPFYQPVINGEVDESDLHLPIPYIALFIFSALAGIVLLIACFNLTNTTIALTGKRMKEIAVRKVMGSGRLQIVKQFLLEMLVTITLAILAGFLLAQVIVPQFTDMWQLQYGLEDLNSFNLAITLILLLFVAALLAGIYPALFSSKFMPVQLLKGGKRLKGTNAFTRLLLVFQFSLSAIVLIAGVIFTQNAEYQQKVSFGYDQSSLLNVSIQGEQMYHRLRNSLNEIPEVEAVAAAENSIGPYRAYDITFQLDSGSFRTGMYNIGSGYFEAVGLKILSGRDFVEGSRKDEEGALIVDENFVKNYQLTDPIGSGIFIKEKPYQIIGVVSNHLSGLKEDHNSEHIYSLALPSNYNTLVVRAAAEEDLSQMQKAVAQQWKTLFPDRPLLTTPQQEIVYEEANGYNRNLKQIFFFLTLLGCLLSASGIYALASLNVQKRIKEIGVRKVLGASVSGIVKLLNREFAIILAIAILFGGALGYILIGALLGDLYSQHIEISILTIVSCCLLIFIVGISATSGTIFRAAITNPSDTLKDE